MNPFSTATTDRPAGRFVDVFYGPFFDFVGQLLDVVGAPQGIDGIRRTRFMGDELLRRRATCTDCSEGRARASSMELV